MERISKSWPQFTKMKECILNSWPLYIFLHVICRV